MGGEECPLTSTNITPDIKVIARSTLFLSVSVLLNLLAIDFTPWYLFLPCSIQLFPRWAKAGIYLCQSTDTVSRRMFLTGLFFFFSSLFCVQRAPSHQIGDTTLPRSDPNLSAPDKGKTPHPVCVVASLTSLRSRLSMFLLVINSHRRESPPPAVIMPTY